METVIIMIITVIAVALAASPFISGEKGWGDAKINKKLDAAINQKDIFYQAIKDVDFELAEGKLNEKDHQELRDYYKEKAIQTVKEIETMEKEQKK